MGWKALCLVPQLSHNFLHHDLEACFGTLQVFNGGLNPFGSSLGHRFPLLLSIYCKILLQQRLESTPAGLQISNARSKIKSWPTFISKSPLPGPKIDFRPLLSVVILVKASSATRLSLCLKVEHLQKQSRHPSSVPR